MIPLAPVTPRKDINRKEAVQKRRLQTDLTAGEKLQSTSVVSRDQEVVPQKGGAIIITDKLWEKCSRKIVQECRP